MVVLREERSRVPETFQNFNSDGYSRRSDGRQFSPFLAVRENIQISHATQLKYISCVYSNSSSN